MNQKYLDALKGELQQDDPKALERLAVDLIGRLIEVRFTVPTSGFQNGADAGAAGRAGRHLRVEYKRCADDSPLDDRNLQGEITMARKLQTNILST